MEITFPGGKRVDAQYKGFTINTDQPKVAGGEGSAPSPFDLFLASIGTCAGIYVLSFCQERNLPTEDVKIALNTERDNETGLIGKINLDILLPSDFPAKYENALIKVASLCAVKKHLEKPPVFNVETKIQ